MKRILALTTINNTTSLKEAINEIKLEYGKIVEVHKVYFDEFENNNISLQEIKNKIIESDIILIDIRGDIRVGRELSSLLKGLDKTIVVLVAGSQQIYSFLNMGKFKGSMIFKPNKDVEFDIHKFLKMQKISEFTKKLGRILPIGILKDMRNWILAQEYFAEGGTENLKNLILFLLKNYANMKQIKKVPPPKKQPPFGLYLPQVGFFEDLTEYKNKIKFNSNRPSVGILFYGGMHFDDNRPLVDSIFNHLKDKVNLIIVFSKVEYNIFAINKYLKYTDLFLNLQYFRIHGGPYGGEPEPTYDFLIKNDSPYLIGLSSYETEIDNWQMDKNGLNPLEVALGIILPELDGGIEPIIIGLLKSDIDNELGKIKKIAVLEDGVQKLCNRILKWINLRMKANSDKKIAIITYNYPPGEESVGNAGYLDVFKSLEIFLNKLKSAGYNVEIPDQDLKDLFLSKGLVNSPRYIEKKGLKISLENYIKWFKSLSKEIQNEVIEKWGEPPGMIMTNGNNIIIPGIILGNIFLGIQPSRGVHEDLDKAYHDKDLPPHHQYLAFYRYIENEFNADAIIHFGMHGTLEFTKGKEVALSRNCFPDILIGNLPHIYYYWIGNTSESTIAKRRSYALCISHASPPMTYSGLYEKYLVLDELLDQYESSNDEKTLELILETASELNLPLEIRQLKKEIYRMRRRLIPYGLHIMDRKYNKKELLEYLLSTLRIDREFPSIFKLVSKQKNLDWEKIKESKISKSIEKEAFKVIESIIENKNIPKWISKNYINYVNDIFRGIEKFDESTSLLKSLEGRYIFPYRGGDPIRDPDVYPSGRAMYAFDPRQIPTVIAELRGKKAAELLIQSYFDKYEKFPESIGIVLWGFETMKTGGDTIATILSLLGVEILHKKNPWFKELKVIPLEDLKRPRIDVVITICGIFRDTFMTHIELINRAIEMVANLDEDIEKNYIKKHYLKMKKDLKDFAMARIFGPSPTEYATAMRTLVENSAWKDEKDLVKSYKESMSYLYFQGKIIKNEQAFANNLKNVNLITQERDNIEYEITDLDHYYEFLGGLSRTVQDVRGENSDELIIDSTEEEVIVEDLKISIERSVRTRILNPKWIKGMLKHEFHGTKKIKDRIEHLLGFAATTHKVENWVFDEVANNLIFNEKLRKKLLENNPYATMKICELLVESENRGYWNTSQDRLNELKNIIINLEGDLE
ncbi:MAG: magnesium chelatase subunit H [Candidatus Helarchaeota archaeon]